MFYPILAVGKLVTFSFLLLVQPLLDNKLVLPVPACLQSGGAIFESSLQQTSYVSRGHSLAPPGYNARKNVRYRGPHRMPDPALDGFIFRQKK